MMERVQNGAYLVEGNAHDTIVFMKDITLVNTFGNQDRAMLIEQTHGAFLTCKYCTMSKTMAKENKVNAAKHDFEASSVPWKLRSRNSFYDVLDKTTAEVEFLPSNN